MLLFTPPPVLIQAAPDSRYVQKTAPEFLSLADAVDQVLEDFDAEAPRTIRDPKVAPADRPALGWLRSAAMEDTPANPFSKGTAASHEAEQVLAFLNGGYAQESAILAKLKISQPGTALALWRWGKRGESGPGMSVAFRCAWEDKLMEPGIPATIRGFSLRHALCFAIAEGDEARFTLIKARWSADAGELLNAFQKLFGLLGGGSPAFRFWELPGLQYKDLRLGDLLAFDGKVARRIWISPSLGELPKLPSGTAWIVPTYSGQQNSLETTLVEKEREAGEALSAQVKSAAGLAYFAPSRGEFEALGLAFFPILIELEFNGSIKTIRMGDAAPKRP